LALRQSLSRDSVVRGLRVCRPVPTPLKHLRASLHIARGCCLAVRASQSQKTMDGVVDDVGGGGRRSKDFPERCVIP
jgi:hypothetical protein